jgi:predicted ATPase
VRDSGTPENSPLECVRGDAGCRFVVLTGGPGAGKTAVLEIARRSFCKNIAFLPEAAGIVFGGGFWRKPSLAGRKAAQRAIYHIQREQESLVAEEGEAGFVLCDRGTIDGLAYWPADEASFWREVGTTREAELAKYHAVLHLRTPPATEGYNHQNPLRLEDAIEAQAIDARIYAAWDGHPRRIVIPSSGDFVTKILLTIEHIKENLPACCHSHEVKLTP